MPTICSASSTTASRTRSAVGCGFTVIADPILPWRHCLGHRRGAGRPLSVGEREQSDYSRFVMTIRRADLRMLRESPLIGEDEGSWEDPVDIPPSRVRHGARCRDTPWAFHLRHGDRRAHACGRRRSSADVLLRHRLEGTGDDRAGVDGAGRRVPRHRHGQPAEALRRRRCRTGVHRRVRDRQRAPRRAVRPDQVHPSRRAGPQASIRPRRTGR
jgi:hypothetical protein